MQNKVCCFTGHRSIKKSEVELLNYLLNEVITELINEGVNSFICGGALGFDTLAELEVLKQKEKFENIKLILALPCKNQDEWWDEKDKEVYRNIINLADEVVYISEKYKKGCMFERNRYMVDNSQYCVSYLRRNESGTSYTVKYARNKNINVIEL